MRRIVKQDQEMSTAVQGSKDLSIMLMRRYQKQQTRG